MDIQILQQKLAQVKAEFDQVNKALSALTKKHDELIGQQAMLVELLNTATPIVKPTEPEAPKKKAKKKK